MIRIRRKHKFVTKKKKAEKIVAISGHYKNGAPQLRDNFIKPPSHVLTYCVLVYIKFNLHT